MNQIILTVNVQIAEGYKPLILYIQQNSDYAQQIRIFAKKFGLPEPATQAIQSQIKINLQKLELNHKKSNDLEKIKLVKDKIFEKTKGQSQKFIQQRTKINEYYKNASTNVEDTPINKLGLNVVTKSKHCYNSKICTLEQIKKTYDNQGIKKIKQSRYSHLTFHNYLKQGACKSKSKLDKNLNQIEIRQLQLCVQNGQKFKNYYTQKQYQNLKQNKSSSILDQRFSFYSTQTEKQDNYKTSERTTTSKKKSIKQKVSL